VLGLNGQAEHDADFAAISNVDTEVPRPSLGANPSGVRRSDKKGQEEANDPQGL
jgi:hypothetical protein